MKKYIIPAVVVVAFGIYVLLNAQNSMTVADARWFHFRLEFRQYFFFRRVHAERACFDGNRISNAHSCSDGRNL